jgi:predicted dehydrogenase
MKTISWAMIGCGDVTEKKSAPALYKSENSRLKSVYSRTYEKAIDYAKRHNIPNVCKAFEEILLDKEIDAVYIATPPKEHRNYAIACLKAGKIPYIEKPMAMNFAQCQEILEASKQYNLPVYVAYYRRGLEKYLYIKSLIDSGILGKILFVRLTHFMKPQSCDLDIKTLPWRLKKEETGGGKFIDMTTHVIDIVQYFFGDIKQVKSFADNKGDFYEVEDTVTALFETEKGILISGLWCYVSDFDNEEMLISGSKGTIFTNGLYYGKVKTLINSKEETKDFIEPEHIAMPYMQMVINEMAGGKKSPADVISAANNIWVIDEVLKSYRAREKTSD